MRLYVFLPDKTKQVYEVIKETDAKEVLDSVKQWPGVHLVSIACGPKVSPMDEFNWSI